MRILALTKYERTGASSRLRTYQYLPFLRAHGAVVDCHPLISEKMLIGRYVNGGYGAKSLFAAIASRIRHLQGRKPYDLVWIEKEALPWCPAIVETTLLGKSKYILDYDDAIFHNYDLHPSWAVKRLLGDKLDRLMRGAALVIAGNSYLADRARRAGARRVEVIPTVIDIRRYPSPQRTSRSTRGQPGAFPTPKLVWIGSPSTVEYLDLIAPVLRRLANQMPFSLKLIGAGSFSIGGLDVEHCEWAEETEVSAIFDADIGLMPLRKGPWELGKCGYKLIQYMACGLPVVASRIGANIDIVDEGVNGFLAEHEEEWGARLAQLLGDPYLRFRMGRAGRALVEQRYCLQGTAPKLFRLLQGHALDVA